MCNFGFRQGYGLLTEEMIMYLTDEQIMLLEQLTYLTDDVADAAGVLLGPYDSVENLLQQFDDDALQRLEDPGNPDSTKPNGQWLKSIRFKLPIIENDLSIGLDNGNQVETVVRLWLKTDQIDSNHKGVRNKDGIKNQWTYKIICSDRFAGGTFRFAGHA